MRALTKPGNSCDFCVKCGGEGMGFENFGQSEIPQHQAHCMAECISGPIQNVH